MLQCLSTLLAVVCCRAGSSARARGAARRARRRAEARQLRAQQDRHRGAAAEPGHVLQGPLARDVPLQVTMTHSLPRRHRDWVRGWRRTNAPDDARLSCTDVRFTAFAIVS